MICACEYKFCTTGNRAELSNHKSVMIDRVMIQHIILLKITRIVSKIVIHCIITNLNIGISNYIFQINCFGITCTGIYSIFRYSHVITSKNLLNMLDYIGYYNTTLHPISPQIQIEFVALISQYIHISWNCYFRFGFLLIANNLI